MALQLKDKVTISGQAGLERKFPAFFRGFVGKIGKIISFKDSLVEVQTDDKDPSQRVWVKRDWLTCNS